MRVFKTAEFAKFARKNRISDAALLEVCQRMRDGAFGANLGAGIYKQRVARQGQGKSGGFRVILFFKVAQITYFVFGFAKNQQENISASDLAELKLLAKEMLSYDHDKIAAAVEAGEFIEIEAEI